MSGRTKLTYVETKLFLRDPTAVFFVIALPIMLLTIFHFVTEKSQDDAATKESMEAFVPAMAISLCLTMLALNLLPTTLATYREKGILRRMAASPVHPANLLLAQLVINLATATLSAVLVLVVGRAAFDTPAPESVGGFVVSFALGTWALFAIGLVIAAVAPGSKAATAIGLSLLFPSLFFGGAFVPKEDMPSTLSTIGDYTPLGAALQALRDSWEGQWPQALHLSVLAVLAVVGTAAAAKLFRWE
ncbi:ABC transporter permease [Streptomyces physcomitrii]|uniref:Transport permease protein n=1 Tax=Streptomyces physcomitrii TaxID=2724184 RepID=A0ABX1HB08_9ACTN|nr:ABC transporter permease [Streptomyces physcomitrii]NKI45243.1 ABC transporter permease [Streptomyces physcomitrii]